MSNQILLNLENRVEIITGSSPVPILVVVIEVVCGGAVGAYTGVVGMEGTVRV
jgi:hypothetical protein